MVQAESREYKRFVLLYALEVRGRLWYRKRAVDCYLHNACPGTTCTPDRDCVAARRLQPTSKLRDDTVLLTGPSVSLEMSKIDAPQSMRTMHAL
jgi:hypothetical protein